MVSELKERVLGLTFDLRYHVKASWETGDYLTRVSVHFDVMYLTLCFLGCLFFPGIFYVIQKLLRQYTDRFDNADVVNVTISVKLVSVVQAVFAVVCGYIITRHCQDDVIYESHWLTNNYASFGVPYMVYDVYAMYLIHCTRKPSLKTDSTLFAMWDYLRNNSAITVHHLALAIIGYPILISPWRNNKGDFFVGCFYLAEITIPFLHARATLKMLGWKKTKLYAVIGVLFIITFFCCRLLLFPYMYHAYGRTKNLSIWQVLQSIPLQCNIGCLVIIAFQFYWFILILAAALRTINSLYTVTDKQSHGNTACVQDLQLNGTSNHSKMN
ncbi:TLC domain-containing protein 3A-like [Glandiceps talaboti]